MAADPTQPAPGFAYIARAPFINHVGPLFQRMENPAGTMTLGLWVGEVHTNTMGLMHGGMIATVCDSAMARSTHGALQRRLVTLRMNMEYFDPVRQGEWIEAEGRLVDHDEEVAYTQCMVTVSGQVRARSTAVFRLLRKL